MTETGPQMTAVEYNAWEELVKLRSKYGGYWFKAYMPKSPCGIIGDEALSTFDLSCLEIYHENEPDKNNKYNTLKIDELTSLAECLNILLGHCEPDEGAQRTTTKGRDINVRKG